MARFLPVNVCSHASSFVCDFVLCSKELIFFQKDHTLIKRINHIPLSTKKDTNIKKQRTIQKQALSGIY